jgi:hypothetical protein
MKLRDYFKRLLDSFREHEATARPFTLPDSRGLSRRSFLGLFAASTAAVATLDLDHLLWTPGEKTIFLPPAVEIIEDVAIVGNRFVDMQWVTNEALRVLTNELTVTKRINRLYAEDAHRLGDSIGIRLPERFNAKRATVSPALRVKTVMLDHQHSIELDPVELRACGSNEEMVKRVIEPAAKHLASVIRKKKLTVMGALEVPAGVEQGCVASAPSAGLSVRGVQSFDPWEHRNRLRLDILGGKG